MKITRTPLAMLILAIGGLLASGISLLAVTNTDSYAEDFEGYDVDTIVTNLSNELVQWYAASSNSVIVSTNYTANYTGGDYPIAYDHATQTKVLKFEDGVTNVVEAGLSSQTNWLDVVLQPVFSDNVPSVPGEGAVAGIFFNTNGNPVVMHTPSNNTTDTEWVTISNKQVTAGKWIRLSIKADMGSQLNGFNNKTRLYQVYIDGTALSNEVAFISAERESGTGPGGTWFGNRRTYGSAAPPFTNLTVMGTGHLDDLVFTNTLVLSAPAVTEVTITGSFSVSNKVYDGTADVSGSDWTGLGLDGTNGTDDVSLATVTLAFAQAGVSNGIPVSITGATLGGTDAGKYTLSLAGAPTATADITAASPEVTWPGTSEIAVGQTLAKVDFIGGSATGVLSEVVGGGFAFVDLTSTVVEASGPYDVWFDPDSGNYASVTQGVAVTALALASTTTNGTTISYYEKFGLAPSDEGLETFNQLDQANSDTDPFDNWQEYIAGTDPTDPDSSFRILGVAPDGTQVQWIGGTNGPPTNVLYIVESAISLGGETISWTNMNHTAGRVEGTNTWTGDPGGTMRFYRIRATAE